MSRKIDPNQYIGQTYGELTIVDVDSERIIKRKEENKKERIYVFSKC